MARHYEHHGMTNMPEYQAWRNVIGRTANPKAAGYCRYGGRGIKICKEWVESFTAFYEHVGPRPSPKHSLDRIDNNGNYEPGNVRWVTRKKQQQNLRTNFNITHNGETKCLREWARLSGVAKETIRRRILMGWTTKKALTPAEKLPRGQHCYEAKSKEECARLHCKSR